MSTDLRKENPNHFGFLTALRSVGFKDIYKVLKKGSFAEINAKESSFAEIKPYQE